MACAETTMTDSKWGLEHSHKLMVRLAKENHLAELMNLVLEEARALTGAEGGTFYRVNGKDHDACLNFSTIQNSVLNIHIRDLENQAENWPVIPLYINGVENTANIASFVALKKQSVLLDDAYESIDFDLSGTRQFDQRHHYRSRSIMTVPMMNHNNEIIGVLQLLNARTPDGQHHIFNRQDQETVEAMAKFAAVTLDNHLLVNNLKNLLDAFIKALAQITDIRSSHTSAHCQRIPLLTELIASAACAQTQGYFQDFDLDEDGWYELHVAAWLHDCGKLTTSENILNKSTRLERLQDGIEVVEARFAAKIATTEDQADILSLREDLQFLIRINQGGEYTSDTEKRRIASIAKTEWVDAYGNRRPLLTDFEVNNLCITRGTINEAERDHINNHINVTIEILEKLPFPEKLKRVPEYAGGHHERMDGTGYPKGLTREQMSIPARIMGVADVFEALTAKERPYKPPMPLSQAFSILRHMKNDQHIDPDVYELFLTSEVWKTYAAEHLLPIQIDVEDITPYLE